MIDPTSNDPLRIADVVFDRQARTIVAAERRTSLDPRSCEVFAVLGSRPNARVDKETLLRAAWPDQIVHENSLAKAISRLRRAIEGSRLEIVASYGVGYMLRERGSPTIGPERPDADSLPAAADDQSSGKRKFPIALPLALLALCASIAALAWWNSYVPMRQAPAITHDAPDAIATILWVDDHPDNNRLEVALFKQRRIAVHLAENSDDALKLLAMNHYDLVISDLGRGEDRLAGVKLTQAMAQRGQKVPVLIYTVRPKQPSGWQAQRDLVINAGAADLAVTQEEVRAKVLERLTPQA